MEIQLNLQSEDYMSFPISPKNKELINYLNNQEKSPEIKNEQLKKLIIEEINNSCMYLKNIEDGEYFDISIKKIENKEINSNEKYNYVIEVNAKEKIKNEIESKINKCIEKEKILLDKQNEFNQIINSIVIDENLLEKKLLTLIDMNKEEYEIIINKMISQILDYNNFIAEARRIEDRLIKYRDSLIIALCFKIYSKRIVNVIKYIISKNIIFLNNEKLFQMLNNVYLRLIKVIINDIYDFILKKISNEENFKCHKEEYEQKINFYRELCYLFPILKYFENAQEKEIYHLEDDNNLNFSEYTFGQIARVNSQIPKRNGLNITLEYFKEHSNIKQACAMSLRRILLIYKKYEVLLPDYRQSSFLYD